MPKFITDFLSSRGDLILQHPDLAVGLVIFGVILGWSSCSHFNKNKLDSNDERMKANDERMKANNEQNEDLKAKLEKLNTEEENEDSCNLCSLNVDEIAALKAIGRFEEINSPQPSKLPIEYAVDNLAIDLNITQGEANEILEKFRRIGFLKSVWDNHSIYPSRKRPINEARSGRLTRTGKDYLNQVGARS